jgi:hypothetical protein
VAEAPSGLLSAAQLALLDAIFDEFGGMSRWDLVALTHTLPEWEDPHGSSVPISIGEILRAGSVGESEIGTIEEGLLGEDALHRLLL